MYDFFRQLFTEWLKQNGVSSDSAKSYSGSYLTRAFKSWDNTADFMIPLENYVSVMFGNIDYQKTLCLLCQTLEKLIVSEIESGKISQRYGDNIRVSINHFKEFVSTEHMQSGKSILLPDSSIVLPTPEYIIKRISEQY